jgi:hypothetical protein
VPFVRPVTVADAEADAARVTVVQDDPLLVLNWTV